jgi:ArsR family transcriptional regulator
VSSKDVESISLESRAAVFSALGDPTRLSILDMLADGERCVCDIQDDLNVAPNLLSYHLRVLREAGLVEASRRGRWMDYRISADAGRAVCNGLPSGFAEPVVQ